MCQLYNRYVFSTLPLRNGLNEYHLCWRLEDCQDAGDGTPTALPFYDQISALYFLLEFITDSGREHELRLWLLQENYSLPMNSQEETDVVEHAAMLIATGQLVVAGLEAGGGEGEGEGEVEGIMRAGGQAASVLRSQVIAETTPLQDEMARRESAAAAEGELVVLDEPEPETTWIEIELIDENGRPVPNERFKLTLPDGSVKWGRLDNIGKSRIERLQPGTCQVTFPDRDEEVWDVG
jgi:hypothetical protein